MKRIFLAILLTTILSLSFSCDKLGKGSLSKGSGGQYKTEQDKTLYALGLMVGKNLSAFNLNDKDLNIVEQGMVDAIKNVPEKVKLKDYGPKIATLAQQRSEARAKEEGKRSQAYLQKAAKEKGVEKTASGLLYQEVKAGTGKQPTLGDVVEVHYHGTLVDGTVFDSSRERNAPVKFPLKGVIPCWVEGVQKMKVGGKAKLICPSEIAYGQMGRPPQIPGGAALVFEIELLNVTQGESVLTSEPGGSATNGGVVGTKGKPAKK